MSNQNFMDKVKIYVKNIIKIKKFELSKIRFRKKVRHHLKLAETINYCNEYYLKTFIDYNVSNGLIKTNLIN